MEVQRYKGPTRLGETQQLRRGRRHEYIPTCGKATDLNQALDTLLGSCSHTLADQSTHTLFQTSHSMSRHLSGQGVPKATGAAGNSAQRGEEETRNAHSSRTRLLFMAQLKFCTERRRDKEHTFIKNQAVAHGTTWFISVLEYMFKFALL